MNEKRKRIQRLIGAAYAVPKQADFHWYLNPECSICPTCGAVVRVVASHIQWHQGIAAALKAASESCANPYFGGGPW